MTKALRKIVVIILSLITVCSIISLTAACKTKIKFNYTLVAGGTAYEISSCTISNPGFSEDGAMVIPSSYKGLPVIGIGSECFEYEQSMFGSHMLFIRKLYLPSTIKYIKADAFKGQHGVRVYIEDLTAWCNISFESMYSNPLAGWCKRYDDDGSGAGYSWDKTFYLNNVLTEDLVIPEGVTKINDYAFCGNAFKSVNLSNVTEIGAEAFSFSYNLESINISNSVEKIGEWAFASTPACQLSVGENVKEIGENAFFDNKHLVEVVNYSDSLTFTKGAEDNGYAAKYALGVFDSDSFEGSKIAIENGDVVYNDEDAKYLVRVLENCDSKVIPSGITAIYRHAFDDSMNEVVIPNTVNKICEYAFSWCGEVKFLGTVEDWCKIEGITNLTYRVKAIEIEGISNGEVELPAWMTEIPNGLFQSVVNLEKITLHDGVTMIGDNAFSDCKNLKTVIFPSSLVAINDYAFYYCESLQGSFNLPEGLTHIGESAFSWCKSITGTVVIPKGVEKISRSAFSHCTGITSFKLQDGIKVIGAQAFYECSGLIGVFNLPSSIEKIGQWAFQYCSTTTIRYDGTKEQFRYIYKATYWDGGTIKEVICDDGKFTL